MVAGLALTACGGDDDDGGTPTSTATSTSSSSATASATATGTASGSATPGETATGTTPSEESIPFETPSTTFTRAGGDIETAVLADIRTGRHESFDRIVFEFEGDEVPGFRVEYVTGVTQCGSGEAVELTGEAFVSISLEPAAGHTDDGEATVPQDVPAEGTAAIREVRGFCDFEAQVGYAVSLSGARPYRVFELSEPARLVVDFSQ
jgi:hypothetical protein